MSDSAGPERRVIQEFRKQYFDDRGVGSRISLSKYLEQWPDSQNIVAREFLSLEARERETDGGDIGSDRTALEYLGPYEIRKLIGRGGQGEVYRAIDTRLGRTVALKVLTRLGPGAELQVKRFRREAQVTSRIDHPLICAVHDAGIENGIPYIAMRFVEGETLAERIGAARAAGSGAPESYFLSIDDTTSEVSANSPQSTETEISVASAVTDSSPTRGEIDAVLKIFEHVAAALQVAHEAGIIHRDIKPGNIMLSKTGEPVILDFGFARDDISDDNALTRTGDVFGTPAYMSPEQIAGSSVSIDRQTDIYSLGVTLYECLTLRLPFEAPTRQALFQAILTKEAPDPRRMNPRISKDLKVCLETAMARDLDKRYRTAAAFAADLGAIRRFEPIAARPVGFVGRAVRWSRRNPARATLVLAMMIGLPLIAWLSGYIVAHMPQLEAQRKADLFEKTEGLLEQGYFELNHGDLEVATSKFTEAIALSSTIPEALAGRVLCEIRRKNFALAAEFAEATRGAIDPTATAYLEAAVLNAEGKKRQSDALLAASRSSPTAIAQFVLAGIEMERAHAIIVESDRPAAFRKVAALMRHAVLASPRPRRVYHFEWAHAEGHGGKSANPEPVVDAIMELWPENVTSDTICGRALVDVNPKRSCEILERALARRPGDIVIRAFLGAAYISGRRFEDARSLLTELLYEVPDRTTEWNNLAIAHRECGDNAASERAYEQILKIDPDDLSGIIGKATMLRESKKLEESAALLDHDLTVAPNDPIVIESFAIILSLLGRADEAESRLSEFLSTSPDNAVLWAMLGTARMDRRKHAAAREPLDRAVALAPDNITVVSADARWYFEAGDYAMARTRFASIDRPDARTPEVAIGLANSLRGLGRMGDCLKELCRAHRISLQFLAPQWRPPTEIWIHEMAKQEVERLQRLGRSDEALDLIDELRETLANDKFLDALENEID